MEDTTNQARTETGPLSHPTREDWIAFLYGEAPRRAKLEMHQHLSNCPSCRENVREWQHALEALEDWELPAAPAPARAALAFVPWKWAAAALFALGLGLALSRFSPASLGAADRASLEASIRASLEPSIRNEVREELRGEFRAAVVSARQQLSDELATLETKYREQSEAVLAALDHLNSRQAKQSADLASFRRETETMAVLTEEGFRRAQDQMVRLANLGDTPQGKARRISEQINSPR